jgi:hypothetical protein
MRDILGWGVVIAPLMMQLALCWVLYLALRRRVLAKSLTSIVACFQFCIVMALAPWAVAGIALGIGTFLFTLFPSISPSSWDVALVMTAFLLLWFSYFVSVVCALIVCPNLLSAGRADESASPT